MLYIAIRGGRAPLFDLGGINGSIRTSLDLQIESAYLMLCPVVSTHAAEKLRWQMWRLGAASFQSRKHQQSEMPGTHTSANENW